MKKDILLVGNSLSILVSANELAKQGCEVGIICTSKNLGGYFSGIRLMEENFDIGMVILELTSFNSEEDPDVASYNIDKRYDFGRFLPLIKKYISSVEKIHKIDKPEMYFRKNYYKDFLLCNDFSCLGAFTESEKDKIVQELSEVSKTNPLHASNKKKNQALFLETPYVEVSAYNHGATLHEQIILPFLRKLLQEDYTRTSALFHRMIWLPVYYPETLKSQFSDTPQILNDTHIHFVKNDNISAIPRKLQNALVKTGKVDIVHEAIDKIDMETKKVYLSNKDTVAFNHISYGGKLDILNKMINVPYIPNKKLDKASLALAFCIIENSQILRKFSVLFIVDEDILAYRITNQSHCSGEEDIKAYSKLVVEYNYGILVKNNLTEPAQIQEYTENTLQTLGIIKKGKKAEKIVVIIAKNALTIPTKNYYQSFRINKENINQKHQDITLMGNASGIETKSFADNIIQGLKYAKCQEV